MPEMSSALRTAAKELYDLPPAEFIAARNARAKEVDKTAAAAIRQLGKAAPAAWLAGQLARRNEDEFETAIGTGADLREAQEANDRSRILEADNQRRALVKTLVERARNIATSADLKPSTAVLDELSQTINAAISDEHAAEAVRSGLLIRSLHSTGLEPVDLTGAVALETDLPRLDKRNTSSGSTRSAQARAERKREAKKREIEEEKRREGIRRARKAAEEKQAEALARVSRLAAELEDLEAKKARKQDDLASARREADTLTRELAALTSES
jgi:hypothetical protein